MEEAVREGGRGEGRSRRGGGGGGGGVGDDSLSRTVKGAVPVGGDQPEEGPPSDHLKISPIQTIDRSRRCHRTIRGQVEGCV